MNDIGVNTGWRILPGTPGFFTTTKRMHNALQGESIDPELIHRDYYLENKEIKLPSDEQKEPEIIEDVIVTLTMKKEIYFDLKDKINEFEKYGVIINIA